MPSRGTVIKPVCRTPLGAAATSVQLYHTRLKTIPLSPVPDDTLGDMTTQVRARRQVMTLAGLAFVLGMLLLSYLLWAVPPLLPTGELNSAALILFLAALLALIFGLGCLVALALHRRWPGLAGVRDARRRADPWVAARQGLLLTLAVAVMVVLALLQMLDVAFALVTLVLAGLIEGFFQNRRTR